MQLINSILNGLSETGRLFIIVFLMSLASILISFWTGGLIGTIIISTAIIAILTVTKNIWESDYDAKTNVRLASLGIIYLLAVSQPKWKSLTNLLLEPLTEVVPLPKEILLSNNTSFGVPILAILGIIFINYCTRDTTTIKKHSRPIDQDFPEKPFAERFQWFCECLKIDLKKIDMDTNWSDRFFTPLDAEVEVQSGFRRLKKVADLLSAIRSDRTSKVFLVLGDPGSGKSVSLRKLCGELLQESTQTGKAAIYINLREWESKNNWTEETPPSVNDLYDFVVQNLKSRGTRDTSDFIDKFFHKLFESGRLFIILDSFDEIPSVLDVSEDSWLIDELSDVIHRFLNSSSESRGILSSRIFRRPTDKFDAQTILEIRPFTEKKIRLVLGKSIDEKFVNQIFKERDEFAPIARNPFTAALISDYVQNNENDLPENQSELYSSYITQSLDGCREKIQQKNLTTNKIIEYSIDIAYSMFSSRNLGLEASIQDLKILLPQHPIDEVTEILKFAKLGRLGTGDENRFSFVHRRFNEYFVVQRLIQNPQIVPKDSIPTDSRWRDALVLYCEVIDECYAKQIANFCWSEIKKITENEIDMRNPDFLPMLHCLRFLKEAFRARPNCINNFRDDLSKLIKGIVSQKKSGNILLQKFSVEAVGLLTNEDMGEAILLAISLNNEWIDEIAFKSCRHISKASDRLIDKLLIYLDRFDMLDFFQKKEEFFFSVKLSDAFRNLEAFLCWRTIDLYFILCFMALFFLFYPFPAVISTLFLFLFLFFSKSLSASLANSSDRFIFFIFQLFVLLLIMFSFVIQEYAISEGALWYYKIGFSTFLTTDVLKIFFLTVLFFLSIPYYKFFFVSSFIRDFKKFLPRFSFLVLGVMSFASMAYFIPKSIMNSIALIFTWIVVVLFSAIFIFIAFQYIYDICVILSGAKNNRKISRQNISDHLKRYKTAWGRLKYVNFIQNHRIKPNGKWMDGKMPNFNNDRASSLLARLEEKWLGLDR
jgi:GTPase SAR1 family protein